ncbi:MAG: endolytic transglycosylase MltG [Acetobacteraceae bacterium]|nr:endolytic transglycosylase MltG [Acetobacteraceae bacterium]
MPWAALFLGVFVASLAAGLYVRSLFEPLLPGGASKVIEFGTGATTAEIARRLEGEGIIKSAWAFRALARYRGLDGRLMAGEYRLSPALSPSAILGMLARGQVVTYQVTVPEGLTVAEVAALLEKRGFADSAEFLEAARDVSFLPPDLREGRQEALLLEPLEGCLFPDTYRLSHSMKPADIVRLMVRRTVQVLEPYRPRAAELRLSLHQVLTLASIIEKEARVAEERALISSVYHNRLRLGMKLDACPTVRYALPGHPASLTFADLQVPSPYNTYLNPGLPPGPIAAPGEACVRAALYPADTAYLYFVARNDGTHVFSRTYAEHLQAVRQYQASPR